MKTQAVLTLMILVQDGEVIVQVSKHESILTVRQPDQEGLAEVRLSRMQARALAEALGHTDDRELDD